MAVTEKYETKRKRSHQQQSQPPKTRNFILRKEQPMNPLTQFKKMLVLPSLIALALVALASPTVVRADAVTDWNQIASNAIVVTALQGPPVSALSFAMARSMTQSTRSTVATSRTLCSLHQIRLSQRKRLRQLPPSACSWASMISPAYSRHNSRR